MSIEPFLKSYFIALMSLLLANEAAAFSTNDQVAIEQALSTGRGWLGLSPAVEKSLRIRAVMGYEKPHLVVSYQITTSELEIGLSAKDGRLVQAINLPLRLEIAKRSEVPSSQHSRMSRAEAERIALAAAERAGVRFDSNFRPWERFGSAPPNNYDAKDKEWRFYWTRHIAEVPVYNQNLSVCIDDFSGKISSIGSGIRSNNLTPLDPKVRIADARDKAVEVAKKLWPKDGDGRPQLWEAYRVVGGNPLCYYLQEELDPAILRHKIQPSPGPKLRLVFIILIGKNLPDSSSKTGNWFNTHHKVMIDALSGEYVPFNE